MRLSVLFCAVSLVCGSAFVQAADDMQAKCDQKLSANAEKLAQVKQLAGLLGNQQANDTIAQVEGGCSQLGANAATSDETVAQTQGNGTAENITAAAETLKGLGSLFGK